MRKQSTRGFTIVELLVVVSIIALLVGILLPAIQKARDQALVTKSQANLRNIATAHATYAGEWNDRQFTMIPDNFGRYGTDYGEALSNFQSENGTDIPWAVLGYTGMFIWGLNTANPGSYTPIDFDNPDWFGAFRIIQPRGFSRYMNGRFYDSVFYAPKDRVVLDLAEPLFQNPGEFIDPDEVEGADIVWSSYCTSPAGMYSPDVYSENNGNGVYWSDPFGLPAGFRSPSFGQAQFPTLKTHVIEHHWLQQQNKQCSPFVAGGTYDGCEPFYFNHSIVSSPVCLFYDGHIDQIGTQQADKAHKKVRAQSEDGVGLWTADTPMGGVDDTPDFTRGSGGYFNADAEDWTNVNFHILTRDGIKGRDKTSE
ncbi:MAG: type II secretion system protein [Planctomycetota bacterium]